MKLTSVHTIKKLLKKHGVHGPSKRFGQNFLLSENAAVNLVRATRVRQSDAVVEVGAGIGTITVELAKYAKKVIAVEKDASLIPILKASTKNLANVEIVQGDILRFAPKDLLRNNFSYQLVGNIPYYITAPLIRKFLESENSPESITLMVQKEMAQRICARPPRMSILAVSIQIYASSKIHAYVPASSFWPMPKVDAAIIRITPRAIPFIPRPGDRTRVAQEFFARVRAGFSSPRKQLVNNLSKKLGLRTDETRAWLLEAGIDPKRRAETLSVEEWIQLSKLSKT